MYIELDSLINSIGSREQSIIDSVFVQIVPSIDRDDRFEIEIVQYMHIDLTFDEQI